MKVPGLSLKLAALLEIVGVFVLGNFLAGQIGEWRGRSLGTVLGSTLSTNPPDWVAAGLGWLEVQGINYACLLLPAFLLGWWRRTAGRSYYGLTRAGLSAGSLMGIGLVGFAALGLGFLLVDLARQGFSLGPHPSPLARFLAQPWTPPFWFFLAIASFAFEPVIEELFYRGYLQTRLAEAYGGPGAIAIVSVLVALGHNQYHHLTVVSAGTILALLVMNLGIGLVYWRYRSLWPCILIHGLVNVPTVGLYQRIEVGAMIVGLILFRRQWLEPLREFFGAVRLPGWKIASLGAALLAAGASIGFESSPSLFVALATLGLVAAVVIASRDRRGHAAEKGCHLSTVDITAGDGARQSRFKT